MLQSQSDAQEPQHGSPREGITNSSAEGAAPQQIPRGDEKDPTPAAPAPVLAADTPVKTLPAGALMSPTGGVSAMGRFLAENTPTPPRPPKRIKVPCSSQSVTACTQ